MLIHLIEAKDFYRGWFRFDKRFLELDGVQENVANAWDFAQVRGNRPVSNKIKAGRKSLSTLKKRANLNSRERILQAEIELECEQSSFSPSIPQIHFFENRACESSEG